MMEPGLRAVIDTNVLFEGLTRKGGASGWIIDAWMEGWLVACVSNSLAYEYTDVLSSKLSRARWLEVRPILGNLLERAEYVITYFSWRPTSPDPADEHVVDCAMNARAPVVTRNLRDFLSARDSLGLRVQTPTEFLTALVERTPPNEQEPPEE